MSAVSVRGASVSLGGRSVLVDVDFCAEAGTVVGLIGPNGAGKTTLLRLLSGLLPPSRGEVLLDGLPLADIERFERARTAAYLPQGGRPYWSLSVEALVMMGRLPHRGSFQAPSDRDHLAVARAMQTCDIEHLAQRSALEISGGELARVLLARVLAGEPRLLLADEPVAGLDLAHQLDVMQTLRGLSESGVCVVVVLHDLSLAARYCDRLVLLSEGTVHAVGATTEVLTPDNIAQCYGVEAVWGQYEDIPYLLPLSRVTS